MDLKHPDASQLEVSLFGPGYGESVLLHLGNRKWVIVDSCFGAWSRLPAPLWYLEKIGANPETDVEAVFISHWHDDHVGGISQVVKRCKTAKVVFSQALRTTEFVTLLKVYEKTGLEESGLNELQRVFGEVVRGNRQRSWARQDLLILKDHTCSLTALSPSDLACERALAAFSKLVKPEHSKPLRIGTPKPNNASVVLWIEAGKARVLLGADLENTQNPETGWTAVLDRAVSLNGKANYFKIPHHGSETGHVERVWEELLEPNVVAGLTPFKGGKTSLPTPDDVSRIKGKTSRAYATGMPRTKKASKKMPPEVQKTLKEIGKTLYEVPRANGIIRARIDLNLGGDWKVDAFGEAGPLHKVYQHSGPL